MMNRKKINILHVVNQAHLAGTERHVQQLCSLVNKNKYSLVVLCLSEGPLINLFKEQNISIHSIPRKNRFDISAAIQIYKWLKKNRFDIIHSHSGYFVLVIAKILKIPKLIETKHGLKINFDAINKHHLLYTVINRIKSKIVNKILTVSKTDKDILIKKYNLHPNQIVYIPNGIDVNSYNISNKKNITAIKNTYNLSKKDFIIGTISRMDKQKGLDYFLEAMVSLKKRITHIKWIVVGEGSELSKLREKAKQLGISDNIIFTGYKTKVREYLSTFHVFVLPSLREGLSYAILEAMAIKCPVITTNIFGNKQLIVNGNSGLLVEPRNSKALVDAVMYLYNNPRQSLRIGLNAHRCIKTSYSAKNMVKRIEQVYSDLLNLQ